MGESLEYPNVLQEVRGAMNPGRLKLQSNMIIFKNIKTGRVDQLQASEVESVNWLMRARGFCLKIRLQNGNIHRFDGLKDTDFEKLAPFVSKYYNTELEKTDVSVRGWNWGVADFVGNGLNFNVHDKLAFEIPLNNVSHSTTTKNEVTVEFHPNDDAAVSLMEIRFHIPSDNTDVDPVQEFHKNVLSKADIIQATGESIVTFEEVQCLTPRGRYDIKIYPSFLQLHGKTFDYKIPYTTILRLFLLPHKDGRQMFFVVSLDPPIKQGQTRYPFLILLFSKEEEESVTLGLSEEDIQEKYEGKLTKEMGGPLYEVVSRIMKALVNRKITVPGGFIGHSGTQAISCSFRAGTGFLYPLERGFMYVHKPPVHIRFDEVASVNFARTSGATSTRSFDFEVETKAGTTYNFGSIDKDEYGKLYDFVSNKGLRVKNIGGKGLPGSGSKSESKYDDMLDSDDDEATHDAYLERMKAEGKEREEEDDDDDSDSEDEDFKPGESGSEVAEEFDTDAESSSNSSSSDEGSGSSAEARKEAKKKRKEKERERKTKTVREGGTKRKRKPKKEKDPDMPKRPQTAYFLWLNDNREKLKKKHPGLSITELSKKAGEVWRELESDEKSKYEKMNEEAKEQYKIAMEEYKAKGGSSKSSKSPKKSPKKSSSDSKAGAGSNYTSKEFISSSEGSSSSGSDSDDKPLKKKEKKEKKSKPKAKATKKSKKEESASEEGSDEEKELPSEEEVLSTPPSSGKSGSESGSDDD